MKEWKPILIKNYKVKKFMINWGTMCTTYIDRGCCSVTKLCLTLCNLTDCSTSDFPGFHCLPEFAQIHVHWVMLSNHLTFCLPLLLCLQIFPSMRVVSNESALHNRWPKYWSFSFSISPSNEHSGLTSFGQLASWISL